MGCDIHLHVEVQIAGRWEHYSELDVERCYLLFGIMAGVRGDERPVAPLRGLPSDLNPVTAAAYASWRNDAHSMSYLLAGEIGEVCQRCRQEVSKLGWSPRDAFPGFECCGRGQSAINCIQGRLEGDVQDVRFVFWFDN